MRAQGSQARAQHALYHRDLWLLRGDSCVILQSRSAGAYLVISDPLGAVSDTSLSIDPCRGDPTHQFDDIDTSLSLRVWACVGIVRLAHARYLVVATDAICEGRLDGHAIWRITATRLVGIPRVSCTASTATLKLDKMYRKLLRAFLSSARLHLCYTMDVTHCMQRVSRLGSDTRPPWQQADERFFWNSYESVPIAVCCSLVVVVVVAQLAPMLFSCLMLAALFGSVSLHCLLYVHALLNSHLIRDFATGVLHAWICPVMDGFVSIEQVECRGSLVTVALLSRRSRHRAGTRYLARGIDPQGRVANFVETEQVVLLRSLATVRGSDPEAPSSTTASGEVPPAHGEGSDAACTAWSWVIVRGSIPLFWTQTGRALRPVPRLQASLFGRRALVCHFDRLQETYGHVASVNLVDHVGREADVGHAYTAAMETLMRSEDCARITGRSCLAYHAFDFHALTPRGSYANLSHIVAALAADLGKHAYFCRSESGRVRLQQRGVMRVNCIDCLDRTNVVQCQLAAHVLTDQLCAAGILSPSEALASVPKVHQMHSNAWANNANVMSVRYTGSAALKTDFTRTGKRSQRGKLADSATSVARFMNKTFRDSSRQESVDLFLGLYNVRLHESHLQSGIANGLFAFQARKLRSLDVEKPTPVCVLLHPHGMIELHEAEGNRTQVYSLNDLVAVSKVLRDPLELRLDVLSAPSPLVFYLDSVLQRDVFFHTCLPYVTSPLSLVPTLAHHGGRSQPVQRVRCVVHELSTPPAGDTSMSVSNGTRGVHTPGFDRNSFPLTSDQEEVRDDDGNADDAHIDNVQGDSAGVNVTQCSTVELGSTPEAEDELVSSQHGASSYNATCCVSWIDELDPQHMSVSMFSRILGKPTASMLYAVGVRWASGHEGTPLEHVQPWPSVRHAFTGLLHTWLGSGYVPVDEKWEADVGLVVVACAALRPWIHSLHCIQVIGTHDTYSSLTVSASLTSSSLEPGEGSGEVNVAMQERAQGTDKGMVSEPMPCDPDPSSGNSPRDDGMASTPEERACGVGIGLGLLATSICFVACAPVQRARCAMDLDAVWAHHWFLGFGNGKVWTRANCVAQHAVVSSAHTAVAKHSEACIRWHSPIYNVPDTVASTTTASCALKSLRCCSSMVLVPHPRPFLAPGKHECCIAFSNVCVSLSSNAITVEPCVQLRFDGTHFYPSTLKTSVGTPTRRPMWKGPIVWRPFVADPRALRHLCIRVSAWHVENGGADAHPLGFAWIPLQLAFDGMRLANDGSIAVTSHMEEEGVAAEVVTVVFGREVYVVDVAGSDLETLQWQLFSLTDVSPDDQVLLLCRDEGNAGAVERLLDLAAPIPSAAIGSPGCLMLGTTRDDDPAGTILCDACSNAVAAATLVFHCLTCADVDFCQSCAPEHVRRHTEAKQTPQTTHAAWLVQVMPQCAVPQPLTLEAVTRWRSTCSRCCVPDPSQPMIQPSFVDPWGRCVCLACAEKCYLPGACRPTLRCDALACGCGVPTAAGNTHECSFDWKGERAMDARTLRTSVGYLAAATTQQCVRVAWGMQVSAGAAGNSAEQQRARQAFTSRVLASRTTVVQCYENKEWQRRALQQIPLQQIEAKARKRLARQRESMLCRAQPRDDMSNEANLLRECVAQEVRSWLEKDCMSWMNQPQCPSCAVATKRLGSTQPNVEERGFGAGHVEVFQCPTCQGMVRFPRLNDPSRILEPGQRKGRCGEYAIAFLLCIVSLGFEARLVNDWTDHVFVEIYFDHRGRWIHFDGCESNAVDAPLLYESGWQKKLTYLVAQGRFTVVDVTRRYTRKWDEVLTRRTLVPEDWLANLLQGLSRIGLESASPQQRDRICIRLAAEQEELQLLQDEARVAHEAELRGRESGDVAWRASRGELGVGAPAATVEARDDATLQALHAQFSRLLSSSRHSPHQWMARGSCSWQPSTPGEAEARVTPSAPGQAGALWLNTALPSLQAGLLARVRFRMDKSGADGMAIVLQSEGCNALGGDGSGKGYAGIRRACAIELDCYACVDRTACPCDNHISIHVGDPVSAHHEQSLGCTRVGSLPVTMSNGEEHEVCVLLQAAHPGEGPQEVAVSVWLNAVPCLRTVTIPMQTLQPNASEPIWFGVTAATGGVHQTHWLLDAEVFVMEAKNE